MTRNTPNRHAALDLFAGTGWGVAARDLNIEENGVEIMPAAQATRTANGFTTVYPDVWTGLSEPEKVPAHDILLASPPCFGAGTPVLTQRGSINIEDVVEGDFVWTHKNRWREVTATMSREAETIKIGPIVTTHDHPFYTRQQVRSWNNGIRKSEWDVADEPENDADRWTHAGVSKGTFFATPLNITTNTTPHWETIDARLAGRYVADGWTGRDGVMIAVGEGTEIPTGEWVISQSGDHCRRFTRSDHELAEKLLRWFGKGAHNKNLPVWILEAPQAWREEFLAGYLAGDGTPVPSGWRANTVSAHLASQLRLLAVSLGYTSAIVPVKTTATKAIEGRMVNQSDYYAVSIVAGAGRYTRDKDGFRWTKQRKDPKAAGSRTVYDITVTEDHSFTAWGYIVHNCQTFSRAGKGAGAAALEDVLSLINDGAHTRPDELQALTGNREFDDRTALVLSPLAYVYRDRPKMVAFEQVSTVLPVWEANAVVLEELGYKVWTGLIHSEQYGVPQTRKRAYLLAALTDDVDEMTPPPATHSQYYPRNPTRLDEGVEKWVTMAEGLRRDEEQTALLPDWAKNRPSTTIVGSFRPDIVAAPGWRKPGDGPRQNTPNSVHVTLEEAARLQSYPDNFIWEGAIAKRWLQVGNAVPPLVAKHVLQHLTSFFR